MGALTISTAARNAACDAVADLCDAGTGTPTLQISSTLDDYVGPELLASIALDGTACWSAASGGVATLTGVPLSDTNASNTGTAAFARIIDRDGTEVMKGTVTVTSGGGFIELDSVSIVAGGTVTVTGGTGLTMPAS